MSNNKFKIFNGKEIYTHPMNDYISRLISIYQCWEPNITFFIDRNFNKSGVFFDIGGNLGYYSLAFSDKFKHVYCFEPNSKNTIIMKKSIEINEIKNISIIENPVAKSSNLFFSPVNKSGYEDSNLGVIQFVDTGNEGLRTVCLDDFIRENGIDFIDLMKVDIEGGEMDCLLGAKKSIDSNKIGSLIIEVTPKFSLEDSRKILNFLSEKYELYDLGLQEAGKLESATKLMFKISDIEAFLAKVKVQTNVFCRLRSK
jgi:FkbM family methyltransferase